MLALRLSVDVIASAIAFRILAQQLLYVLGVLTHMALIAVVTIDEHHEVGGFERDLGALIVGGGRSHATLLVAVDGQSGNVYHSTAYALVRFALASYAQG